MKNRNLYDNSIIISYNEGDISLERILIPPTINQVGEKGYTVKERDTLTYIAHLFYSDSRLWWKIADRNNLDMIFELTIGQQLIIPPKEDVR